MNKYGDGDMKHWEDCECRKCERKRIETLQKQNDKLRAALETIADPDCWMTKAWKTAREALLLITIMLASTTQAEVVRHRGQSQECVNGRCTLVNGYATAFSVANSRGCSYWLTVAHGVPTMQKQWMEIDGQRYECSTITRRKDQLYDYALIRCDGYTAREVYCLPTKQVVGPVSVTGFPETRTTPTTLQTTFGQSNDRIGPQRLYKAYGTYVQGWSGAPALIANQAGQKMAVGVVAYSDGTCTPTAYIRREIAQYVPGGFQCEIAPSPPELPDAPLPKVPCCPSTDNTELTKRVDDLEKKLSELESNINGNLLTLTDAVEANSKWIATNGSDLQQRLDRLEKYRRRVEMIDPNGKVYSSREYSRDEAIRLYGVTRSVTRDK